MHSIGLRFYAAYAAWGGLFAACYFGGLLPPWLYRIFTGIFLCGMVFLQNVAMQDCLDRILRERDPELAKRAEYLFLLRGRDRDVRRQVWALPETRDLKEDVWFLATLAVLTFVSIMVIER